MSISWGDIHNTTKPCKIIGSSIWMSVPFKYYNIYGCGHHPSCAKSHKQNSIKTLDTHLCKTERYIHSALANIF